MFLSGFTRGALAGAAGTTALNTATYLDMAFRGRPTSSAPEDTVEAIATTIDVSIPGDGDVRDNRVQALGALQGIGSGVAVGAVFGWLHDRGLRLPRPVGAVLIGAAAMALSDATMAKLGVTDPTTWSAQDWLSDAVPHLVFGWVTVTAINADDASADDSALI